MSFALLPSPATMSFSHAARYSPAAPRWPLAEVELAAVGPGGLLAGSPITTVVLVDSGADITMLDEALASALGIDLAPIPAEMVGGVGGRTTARRHDVMIDMCGRWISAPVLFSAGQRPQLLGRAGVFDRIDITFVHRLNVMLGAAA